MRILRIFVLASLCVLICSAFKAKHKVTIYLIGDSTMANKDISDDKQERGWGMMLKNCFSDDVVVVNKALNGRSSKSFIDEGHWQEVVDKLQPGDYLFIQFGHNDEKPDPKRHTTPGSSFDANLRRFVTEAEAKGAYPVLFSSVVRRSFIQSKTAITDDDLRTNSSSGAVEGDSLIDTHGDYLISPRKVAEEMNVPFIDANKITHDLEQGLGKEGSKNLHMIFAPGETLSLPDGRQDNTHYNINGAITVAQLLAKAVSEKVPGLRKYYRYYDITVSADGSGRYFDLQQAVDKAPKDRNLTIMIGAGSWRKPDLHGRKNIKFVLRQDAVWAR